MAGLLTCPIPDRLPKGNPLSGKDYRKYPRNLQQRVCPGLLPDSLFITYPLVGGIVSHKPLQRYMLFLKHSALVSKKSVALHAKSI